MLLFGPTWTAKFGPSRLWLGQVRPLLSSLSSSLGAGGSPREATRTPWVCMSLCHEFVSWVCGRERGRGGREGGSQRERDRERDIERERRREREGEREKERERRRECALCKKQKHRAMTSESPDFSRSNLAQQFAVVGSSWPPLQTLPCFGEMHRRSRDMDGWMGRLLESWLAGIESNRSGWVSWVSSLCRLDRCRRRRQYYATTVAGIQRFWYVYAWLCMYYYACIIIYLFVCLLIYLSIYWLIYWFIFLFICHLFFIYFI